MSPIQIQILIFIAFHKQELCNVSHLAKEFNITKPTVSDAVKVLDKKELITKDFSSSDNRSYSIRLSVNGEKVVSGIHNFADPLQHQVNGLTLAEQQGLYGSLSELIYKLHKNGILTVQRTCYGCKFHEKLKSGDYCNLLEVELLSQDIPLDCPEFVEKAS